MGNDEPVTGFHAAAKGMSLEIYQQLKRSVEIGRWPDGRVLSEHQRHISLQAIIYYEQQHVPPDKRSGYISAPNATCSHTHEKELKQVLRWKENNAEND